MNDPKMFKLDTGKISYRRYGLGSKGQSSSSWSCKTYFRRSSGAREFALYRVTLDDEMMLIVCRTTTYTSKWVSPVPGR